MNDDLVDSLFRVATAQGEQRSRFDFSVSALNEKRSRLEELSKRAESILQIGEKVNALATKTDSLLGPPESANSASSSSNQELATLNEQLQTQTRALAREIDAGERLQAGDAGAISTFIGGLEEGKLGLGKVSSPDSTEVFSSGQEKEFQKPSRRRLRKDRHESFPGECETSTQENASEFQWTALVC